MQGHIEYGLAADVAPNSALGSCLDQDWVDAVEAELSISADVRHPTNGDKLNPFLHSALSHPRFWVRSSSVICLEELV